MRKWLLCIVLFITELAFCQFSDEQLYMAYMSSDLSLWGEYINAQDWEHLSHAERKRLINYEYGYIPVMANHKHMDEAERYLPIYLQHLEEERDALSPSAYLTYRSAGHAYAYLLDKSTVLTEGRLSFKLAKQALEADPNDPIAMTLKGNVDFYAPKILGGDKKHAIQLFLKAEKIMLENKDTYQFLWNLPAIQLGITQCYDQIGELDKAIAQAEKTLHMHPHFAYLRDVYLPQLKQKKQKK